MENAKEEIRARLPIEDVVSQYIELTRAGRSLKGHSPWGTDKTPSFMVSPEKGIWHDFSSNKGGDIFSFIMEMEGCDFREALEKLAKQAGVELKQYSEGDRAFAKRKQRCYDILELATKYYQFCLSKKKSVQQYVGYKRNLNKNTVLKFRIGYAPGTGKALYEFLKKRGYSDKEMDDAGLLNRFGGDMFRERMMVPLMDESGRVIGFTARKLDDKDVKSPKYLNTPETILYNKGRHIFGFSLAKEAIRRSDYIVVVEGNMDVISSHQAGVCQAVATAGTAMTEMHLKSFARASKDIRLAYDGDEAGVRAAERAVGMASKFGIYMSIVDDYHGCKDADELIQKDPELWKQAVENYRPAIEWLLEKYEERYDLKTERGFREYCAEAKALISQIDESDAVLREKYERLTAERLGVSLEAFRANKVEQPAKKRLKKPNIKPGAEEMSAAHKAEKDFAALVKCGGIEEDEIELQDFNEAELQLIFEEKYEKFSSAEREAAAANLRKVIRESRQEGEKRRLEEELRLAEEAGDDDKAMALLAELNKLNKLKAGKRPRF